MVANWRVKTLRSRTLTVPPRAEPEAQIPSASSLIVVMMIRRLRRYSETSCLSVASYSPDSISPLRGPTLPDERDAGCHDALPFAQTAPTGSPIICSSSAGSELRLTASSSEIHLLTNAWYRDLVHGLHAVLLPGLHEAVDLVGLVVADHGLDRRACRP